MKRSILPALLLIFTGIYLILANFDILYFTTRDLITYGAIILGIILFVNGLSHPQKKGILGGTFFFVFGIILTLMRNHILSRNDTFGFAMFFLSLAVANWVYFLFRKERTGNFISGIVFGLIGSGLYLSYTGVLPTWLLMDWSFRLWPIILILIGLAMVINAFRRGQSANS